MQFITQNSLLPPYMAFPRFLLETELNDTARMVYMLLLDRSRISQKNDGWRDETGAVFVIFPIADLAKRLHRSIATIKTALLALEQAGFIKRCRQGTGRANRIFVKIPEHCFSSVSEVRIQPPDGSGNGGLMAGKPAASNNNRNDNDPINNHRETPVAYGEYQNVLLTEYEIHELERSVPGYRYYIDALSEYMESTGRKYKNHAATIRSWARKDASGAMQQSYRHENYCFKEGDSL